MHTTVQLAPYAPGWRKFLVDFRVVISFVLITTLVVSQIFADRRPCGCWLDGDWQGRLGALLVLLGVSIRSWAASVLWKGKGLASAGPYSLCKHPLYLGSASMVLGFCTVLNNPWQWLLVAVPIGCCYWVTMLNEEARLTRTYGRRWLEYSARVPRFLPWRWANYVHAPISPACWLRNREYRAFAWSLFALAALEYWRLS
jgi:protein-S-isoprenylcysteine O-methyltransferase Ste14